MLDMDTVFFDAFVDEVQRSHLEESSKSRKFYIVNQD